MKQKIENVSKPAKTRLLQLVIPPFHLFTFLLAKLSGLSITVDSDTIQDPQEASKLFVAFDNEKCASDFEPPLTKMVPDC